MKNLAFIFILFLSQLPAFSQNSNATLYGKITDEQGNLLDNVNISLPDYPFGTNSNRKGEYVFRVPSGRELRVSFSIIGYATIEKKITSVSEQMIELDVVMVRKEMSLNEVTVTNRRQTSGNMTYIDSKVAQKVTDVGIGTIDGVIKTLPGVASNNELSSSYSVRGGNFDENVVYVNDVEIYRPFLIRAGQQEGLSFVNSDMVSSIEFSAGGFDAKYGDKMSSVLDIKYRKPTKLRASASASLLGATMHVENVSKNKKFSYLVGARYKTFAYLMGTLDQKGEYRPSFYDIQSSLNYSFSEKWDLSFLGNFSSNRYTFVPESSRSDFGTYNLPYSVYVYYEGQEVDRYNTSVGALTATYQPNKNVYLKFISSLFTTNESETFDIIGYYSFNEIGKDPAKENFGDSALNLGYGMYHEHGRNFMNASVFELAHRGGYYSTNNYLQWGVSVKNEVIDDRMREWEYRDSAGYSLPHVEGQLNLYRKSFSNYSHNEYRASGYLQNTYSMLTSNGKLMINAGVRSQYWSLNKQFTLSPRLSASYIPTWEKDFVFRLSAGVYHQPPFFKELKNIDGNVNTNVQTPRSFQFVAGTDYSFTAWDRPFKFTAETYYKILQNLIPYQLENVRIRYLSDKISDGYATGIDMKINGEFVSGTQSWASLSVMKTMEDIRGDGHGYIPRPNDQRVTFSLFFQDYLPKFPEYQMQLTGHISTGMPFGPPKTEPYLHTARMKSYRRVDVGFSRTLVGNGRNTVGWKCLDKLQECHVALEIFNMIDIKNVSSYFWVADFTGLYYPVPNHLTGRRFNLKLTASF